MANQTDSPNEARIAREKLAQLGPEKTPKPSTVVKNVSTWVDITRNVVITEITFADGRKDRKEIQLPGASGVNSDFFRVQFTASYTGFGQQTSRQKNK